MDKLYYISQGLSPEQQLSGILKACSSGIQMVQLRMKETPEEIILSTAMEAKKICASFQSTLIVNDHISIAKKTNADGVHLGKKDASIAEAREILGKNSIIGGTANTLEDCNYWITNGANYIGLGPYAFTETKKNLSPLLGIEGYTKIINELKSKYASYPIYAIGGILQEDIQAIFETGVHGIAASGLLYKADKALLKQIQAATPIQKT